MNWKQPADALNLASFLGITGHFRDLIKDYAKIEGPLRELIKEVPLPSKYNKTTYWRTMEAHKLAEKWTERHTKAFIGLKAALASEPVLKAPRWDGTHFILTTDRCKEALLLLQLALLTDWPAIPRVFANALPKVTLSVIRVFSMLFLTMSTPVL